MDELVNRFENFDMNDTRDNRQDNQNLLTKFLTEIDNDYQSDIVLKLFCGYSGYSGNLYLSDYSKETNTVYILGSRSRFRK